jgi:hypothetical protein
VDSKTPAESDPDGRKDDEAEVSTRPPRRGWGLRGPHPGEADIKKPAAARRAGEQSYNRLLFCDGARSQQGVIFNSSREAVQGPTEGAVIKHTSI